MKMIGMLAMASAVVLAGCGGDDDDVEDLLREPAEIYFHNQITDTGAGDASTTTVDLVASGDVLFNQRPYSTDEQDGLRFKLNADAETVTFRVNSNHATELVKDTALSLSAGAAYTLVAMGQVSGVAGSSQEPMLKLYPQSRPSVAAGTVKVRLINALSEREDQPITVNTNEVTPVNLATNLAYGDVSAFTQVTPETAGKLMVTVDQTGNPTGNVECDTITAGKSYDVIVAMSGFGDAVAMDVFCQQVDGS
ncbi:hypothetical protein [Alcanivorax sp.]|jgi:hypothetical protein|uniref:hypothetical protein n=1 Tax=Alcanivorax sp. TaxID=1872427 RepID=UPI0032D8D5A2